MRNYIGYIIDYTDGKLTDSKRKWFEYELFHNKSLLEEYELFTHIKNSMRGKFDLEEVLNDPELPNVNILANQIILEYKKNPNKNNNNADFISNSLLNIDSTSEHNISNLSSDPEINRTTKQWVEEWNTKDHSIDPKSIERRDFINSAFEVSEQQKSNKSSRKSFAIRVIGFAAAALIAIVLIIKSFAPSDTSNSLYQEYYKPLNAFTSTTRSGEIKIDNFSDAIEKYNKGEYLLASKMLNELISIDNNSMKYKFYSGITQLQLGNYQLAIEQLNQVLSNSNEFNKDANWYLGLAYLKVGNTNKAISEFKKLSNTKGYYQQQAQDLLKRLK